MKFIKYLKELFITQTGKDTAIVTIGTVINVIAGGLFFIVVPRILGPEEYGVFSTVISTSVLLITIANFGIDTGILRFAKKDTPQYLSIISLAFKAYLLLGITLAVFGLVLSPAIAIFIKSPESVLYLRIAFIFSIFILLTNYFVAALQAKGDFTWASLVNISGNVSRLVVLLMALWFLKVDLLILTFIFFLTPLVSVIFGFLKSPPKMGSTGGLTLSFFRFNFWIALALVISSIPYDNYLLMNLVGAGQTGIYQAPFKLLTFAYIFGGNFSRVLAKRYSSFDTKEKAISFSLKIAPFFFAIALILTLTIPFSSYLINIFFTSVFIDSANVYNILAFGFSLFFLSIIPSSIILYFLGKSEISFYITLFKYIIFVSLLLVLIPKFQARGAALAFTLSEFVSFVLMSSYSFVKTNK